MRALGELTFTGDVWAVPEGRIVFANEPLLEVTAPIAEAQLVETYLLNQVTLHTTLTSKAARCRIAARGHDLVDFSMRRTHGIDAALATARATALVGFVATSNVEAARQLGLQPNGTMAHSYIEAFANEVDAFAAYAEDWPGPRHLPGRYLRYARGVYVRPLRSSSGMHSPDRWRFAWIVAIWPCLHIQRDGCWTKQGLPLYVLSPVARWMNCPLMTSLPVARPLMPLAWAPVSASPPTRRIWIPCIRW